MRPFKSKFVLASIFAMLALLVAACGSSTATGGTSSTGGKYDFTYKPTKPAPQTGGTVVSSDWQGYSTTNPITTSAVSDIEVTSALWSSCLAILPDLSLGTKAFVNDQCDQQPTSTNGGQTITMHFPTGLKWSNGNPLTSADYAFWVNLEADSNVGGQFPPYDTFKDVKTPDAQTLVVDFSAPVAAYQNFAAGIQPLPLFAYPGVFDATTGKYDTNAAQALLSADNFTTHIPAFNGPFMLKEFTAQDVIVVKNPNYTSAEFTHPANLDQVIYRPSSDKDVEIQSYKTGTLTDAQDFSEADLLKFAGINTKEVQATPLIEYEHADYNERPDSLSAKHNKGVSIFGGPNGQLVRQAFSESIDRCKLLSGILGESCSDPNNITNVNTAPPASDFDPSVPAYKLDATDAASLMTQAGYPLVKGARQFADGTPLTVTLVTTAGNPVRLSFLTLMCQQLSSALNIGCTTQTYKGLFNFYNKGGALSTSNYDISLFAFENTADPGGGAPDFESNQVPSATLPSGQNFAGVGDSTLDGMYKTAQSELDATKRTADYKAIQLYMHDHFYNYPLYVRKNISLHQATAGNYAQGSFSEGNFWNMGDWFTTKSAS